MTTITDGITTLYPTLWINYTSDREANTKVHALMGGGVALSLAPASPRTAAVALLGMISEAREQGRTLADLLDQFAETFGWFQSGQVSLRVDDVSVIARIMAALRAAPPAEIGGVAVERFEDLLEPGDGAEGEVPPADVLRLWLADGSRVIVRPSGTEPKLKAYLDVRGDSASDAAARLASLAAGARTLIAAAQA